jgi:hypothetical protein
VSRTSAADSDFLELDADVRDKLCDDCLLFVAVDIGTSLCIAVSTFVEMLLL